MGKFLKVGVATIVVALAAVAAAYAAVGRSTASDTLVYAPVSFFLADASRSARARNTNFRMIA